MTKPEPEGVAEIREHERFCTHGTINFSNPKGTNCNCGAKDWNTLLQTIATLTAKQGC